MIPDTKREKIALEIIRTLFKRFESFPEDSTKNRNAPFHEAFLQAFSDKFNSCFSDIPFFISLSSWLHGLNTTLGQSFFENIAHIVSDSEKKEFTSKKEGTLQINKTQKESVSSIITQLSNDECQPDLESENYRLFNREDNRLVNAIDFTADVFINDSHNIAAIELKTVKPNSGEMRGEKQKILEGKAALYSKYPDKQIKFHLGFPFDPTHDPKDPTGYNKKRFMKSCINMTKYFAENEILLASELWD
ncbi:MAG: TdeIII family type II restriction endonuclease, partial [Candidatus Lokiarchaeota archaeon]|nr:TdeIII family type II restriction endonuclease [Candidatus Lokiarchaeota archaeon]